MAQAGYLNTSTQGTLATFRPTKSTTSFELRHLQRPRHHPPNLAAALDTGLGGRPTSAEPRNWLQPIASREASRAWTKFRPSKVECGMMFHPSIGMMIPPRVQLWFPERSRAIAISVLY